jgi:hypothetical protein
MVNVALTILSGKEGKEEDKSRSIPARKWAVGLLEKYGNVPIDEKDKKKWIEDGVLIVEDFWGGFWLKEDVIPMQDGWAYGKPPKEGRPRGFQQLPSNQQPPIEQLPSNQQPPKEDSAGGIEQLPSNQQPE